MPAAPHRGAGPGALVRSLTLIQHGLFVALVLVGTAQAIRSGDGTTSALLAATALLCLYTPGTRTTHSARWLLVLTSAWLLAVVASTAFVWVAFSLWLLAGHLLSTWRAIGYTVAVLAVVLAALVHEQSLTATPFTAASVIGPSVGALFALGLSRGQNELARDAVERARLLDSLVAAQHETAALQDQLLASQRAAGALDERTRLSRDIHDTLAQGFSSIVLLSRSADTATDVEALRSLTHRIGQVAADNLAESRRVVAALAPMSLTDNGIGAALQRLAAEFTADTTVPCQVHIDGSPEGLSTTVEVALLRTAQGALANVRQHAHASQVALSLLVGEREVRLDVVDDGAGFDAAQLASRARDLSAGGYGLASTRARLRELGGDLTIESAPGDGTTLSAQVPR